MIILDILQNPPEITENQKVIKSDCYKLTEIQNYLYRKAIMGLKGIPPNLINKLSYEQKRDIERLAKKVQRILNIWKQEICINRTNTIFKELFPNTLFTNTLINDFSKPDIKYFNTLDFKVLGIKKEDIIAKLIENHCLPLNFYEL
jgi:hypothetical protein